MEPRIVLETPLKEAGERKLALCLVGKILTTKLINRDAFRAIIPKIWRTTQSFIIENVKENVFVFQFQNQADKRRVLTGGPWSFDKCLIVLEEPRGDGKFLDMGFSHVQFWVQLHNVPLVCMTKEIGWALGNKIGRVMDIDVSATGDCLGRFLRVRVVIDVTKPLNRFLRVCLLEGDPDTVLLLRYERLAEYCFQCGVVGHVVRECQIAYDSGGSSSVPEYKFGTWMRAESPPKVRYSRTVNKTSSGAHKQNQGSIVPRSPGHEDTRGVPDPLEPPHARGVPDPLEPPHATSTAPMQPPPLISGSGSIYPIHNPHDPNSNKMTALHGAGSLRAAVGATKNSDLHGAGSLRAAVGVSKNSDLHGLALVTSLGPGKAHDVGMVVGVKGAVQREETEAGFLGEGDAKESLGFDATGLVDQSEVAAAHVPCVELAAAHVLGGLPHGNSGHVLARDQAGHVGASLVHPCMVLLDGQGSAAHVLPKVAAFNDYTHADYVPPCLGLEHDLVLSCLGLSMVFQCIVRGSPRRQLLLILFLQHMLALLCPGFSLRLRLPWKLTFLWGLNIPAKVRMFVWRACRNLLPTRSLLTARRVLVGAGCPLCDAAVESVLHSLWLCRSLAESKAAVPFLASLRLPAKGSFLDFILACFSILLVHEMELLWRFWFRRNRAVHSAPLLFVEDTVGWSERFLVDFQAAVAVPSVRCDLVVERWLAPSPGWVKINSDVAVDVRGRRLGFGVVIRDCTGKVLVSYMSLLLGLFSSDIGEALAILLGLRLAIDMGLSTVCVESDAASVVKQLSSRVTSCSDIGLILDDILSLVVNFADLSFSSVRRSANIVAHGLAKFALSHQPVGVRLGSVPSSLALVVLDDSRSCP
ncbi:hypothetical protein ACOSQ2_020764 [Xanthoceras sorbifolium]